LTSEITEESQVLSYAILYMGEHNVTGGVRHFDSPEAYETMIREVKAAYDTADFPQTVRVLDQHLGDTHYSLKSLFKDEQRRILNEILATTREDLENRFRLITERYEPLVKFMHAVGAPSPTALEAVFELVLRGDIRREIEAEKTDLERLRGLLETGRNHHDRVLDEDISFAVKNKMERLINQFAAEPNDAERLTALTKLAEVVMPMRLGLNLWKVQDIYWDLLQKVAPQFRQRSEAGEREAVEWVYGFTALGERLGFAMNNLKVPAATGTEAQSIAA
jgi:hypothetical protein